MGQRGEIANINSNPEQGNTNPHIGQEALLFAAYGKPTTERQEQAQSVVKESPEQTWKDFSDLRLVAKREERLDNRGEAIDAYKEAAKLLGNNLEQQPNKELARNALMQTLLDCGRLLSRPPLTGAGVEKQRQEAREGEAMYKQALEIAKHYNAPSYMQADILNMLGFNQVSTASTYYDPHKTVAEQYKEDLVTYRTEMATAIKTYEEANRLLSLENPDSHAALKISVLGNLALAETGLANKVEFDKDKKLIGDKYAVAADEHYLQAAAVYGNFRALEGVTAQQSTQVDKAFLDYVLKNDRYPKLLPAIHDLDSYRDLMTYRTTLQQRLRQSH